jgi:hypothetical protein
MFTRPSKKNARARRSSVMEAHNVFDVYHKHQEIPETFEELSAEMEAEDAKDDADAESESHEIPKRGRKPSPSFPQFHKGTYVRVLCLLIFMQYSICND